jgi:Raf kinase inhibitor-like YbhB/YbcL family protein
VRNVPVRCLRLATTTALFFWLAVVAIGIGDCAAQTIVLESPALKEKAAIPKRYTTEGKNVTPPLAWRRVPERAMELALVFEDTTPPRVHWLLYQIPARVLALPENLAKEEVLSAPEKLRGIIQGLTDFKQVGPGYVGPSLGDKDHQYTFTIYALDAHLGLQPGLDKASLMFLIKDHIVGKGVLTVGRLK